MSTSASVDRFNTAEHAWFPCQEMDIGRSSPCVVAIEDKIWVLGGLRRREMLTSCCCYDPSRDTWKEVAKLPEKIAYFSSVTVGYCVWILGGIGQDYTCRKSTFKFDTKTMEFVRGPDLNFRRKGSFSFVYLDKIYVCGGSVDGMKYLDTFEILDLKNPAPWTIHKLNLKNFNCNFLSITALTPVRFL